MYSMPSEKLTPNAWKIRLQDCRDAVLFVMRLRHHATVEEHQCNSYCVPEKGEVKVVEAEYFRRNFKARKLESTNTLRDKTVQMFFEFRLLLE